ncbi:hypothetical protein GCM10009740_31680 [Terrabacter terrae]|uniref:Uncharacterized protein n=1 Tax=Terrabacter terrae TaxID=318434 RepID=A0ABP5G022_9MICO
MSTGIQVERVLDRDTQHVQVAIDPEQIVDGLARALKNQHIYLTLLLQADPETKRDARARLVRALSGDAFTVVLSPTEARQVSQELDEVAREAYPCAVGHCESLADEDYCDAHLDAGAGLARSAS